MRHGDIVEYTTKTAQPDHPNPLYRLYYYYIMCDVIRLFTYS